MKHSTCEQSESEKEWRRAFRRIDELEKQYNFALHEKLSASRIFGWFIKARQSAVRWRSPPDSFWTR